jgi:hypothetical protein
MKFILFLLLFTAPPAEGPKAEAKRAWSLQSSSALEFASPQGCNAAGRAITQSLVSVNTVTMRAWCFCESIDPARKCPETKDQSHLMILESLPKKTDGVSVGIETFSPPGSR